MRAIVTRPSSVQPVVTSVVAPIQPDQQAVVPPVEPTAVPIMEPVVTTQAEATNMAPVVPGLQPITEYGDYYVGGVLVSYDADGVKLAQVASRPDTATKMKTIVIALGDVVVTATSNLVGGDEPAEEPVVEATPDAGLPSIAVTSVDEVT